MYSSYWITAEQDCLASAWRYQVHELEQITRSTPPGPMIPLTSVNSSRPVVVIILSPLRKGSPILHVLDVLASLHLSLKSTMTEIPQWNCTLRCHPHIMLYDCSSYFYLEIKSQKRYCTIFAKGTFLSFTQKSKTFERLPYLQRDTITAELLNYKGQVLHQIGADMF